MINKIISVGLVSLLVFFLVLSIAQAPPEIPADWWGTVTINGELNMYGAVVTAYVNNNTEPAAIDIVGTPDLGYYLIHVPGNNGDTVVFRVNGTLAYPTNETPQILIQGSSTELNLTIDMPYYPRKRLFRFNDSNIYKKPN